MLSQAYLEYRCPRCGYINAIAKEVVLDMYKEQFDACHHCQQKVSDQFRPSFPGGATP